MRVAILTTSFPRYQGDYAGIFVYDLARSLVDEGLDVRVLAPHAPGCGTYAVLSGIEVRRFRYFWPDKLQVLTYGAGIPANIKERPACILQVPFLVTGFIRAGVALVQSCDIIHAHWTLAGLPAEILGKLYRKPVVLHMHGAEVYTHRIAPLIRPVVNHADHVICNSSYTEKRVRQLTTPKATSVIPFGVNKGKVLPKGLSSAYLRQHLGLKEESHIVSFLGRLVARKGVDNLIGAVQLLVEQGYPVHLAIGGTGPQREEWETLAKHLGIYDHVTFLGFIPDDEIAHFFASSDVFVLPAITDNSGDTEGLGVVLLEAMANGVPTIATKVGGISDVIVNGKTGFLVEQRSQVQLAERIALLCQKSEIRTSMGQAGRERVQSFFSWTSIVERTLPVYSRVLTQRARERGGND